MKLKIVLPIIFRQNPDFYIIFFFFLSIIIAGIFGDGIGTVAMVLAGLLAFIRAVIRCQRKPHSENNGKEQSQ